MSPTLEIVRGQASPEELAALAIALVQLPNCAVEAAVPAHQLRSLWRSCQTWELGAEPFGRRR